MLNNNIVLSFLISLISTLFIHICNKTQEEKYNEINKSELIKTFIIIFIVSVSLLFLRKNKMSGGGITMNNLRSGENLLTHSARPPF